MHFPKLSSQFKLQLYVNKTRISQTIDCPGSRGIGHNPSKGADFSAKEESSDNRCGLRGAVGGS
jgi:hypothetical protein